MRGRFLVRTSAARQTTHSRPIVYGISAPEIPDRGIYERSKNAKKMAFLAKMASFWAKKRAKNGVCCY
jgi:hypothetical protein